MKVYNVKVGKFLDLFFVDIFVGYLLNNCCYMWFGRENFVICIYSGYNIVDR